MDMEGRAKCEAGFPGDSFRFEVSPPKGSDCEVEWSGGGEPAAGRGPRFTTVFVGRLRSCGHGMDVQHGHPLQTSSPR